MVMRGCGEDIACARGGGEAVVAGKEEGVDGRGGRGEGWTVQEGSGDGVCWEEVVSIADISGCVGVELVSIHTQLRPAKS